MVVFCRPNWGLFHRTFEWQTSTSHDYAMLANGHASPRRRVVVSGSSESMRCLCFVEIGNESAGNRLIRTIVVDCRRERIHREVVEENVVKPRRAVLTARTGPLSGV
ncbi:hypothetical protein EVAR_95076_1 [Eumeta japonica]|uniref:Uncharacterized protein n=1 Tax=Eumeta variegata TaxID=151549 RepID=A0A4C1W904_EUMVA|nr:hypothetical protein EVAR_95076_1 [Eumeta japonica]